MISDFEPQTEVDTDIAGSPAQLVAELQARIAAERSARAQLFQHNGLLEQQLTTMKEELAKRTNSAPGGGLDEDHTAIKSSDSAKLAVLRREYLKLKQSGETKISELETKLNAMQHELHQARDEASALAKQLSDMRVTQSTVPYNEQKLYLLEREREQLVKDVETSTKELRELQLKLVRTTDQDSRRLTILEKDNSALAHEVDEVRSLLQAEQQAASAVNEKWRQSQSLILDLEDKLRAEQQHLQRTRATSVAMKTGILQQGWMIKQGGTIKSWKRRWCTLTISNMLHYYGAQEDTKPKGSVDVSTVTAVRNVPGGRSGTPTSNVFELVTPKRVYVMCCDDAASLRAWLEVVKPGARTKM